MAVSAATGRRTIPNCEADPRIGSSFSSTGFLSGVEIFGPDDLGALLNEIVGGAKVFVNYLSNGCPTVIVAVALALVFEVLEDAFAVLFHSLNPSEEGISLGSENGRG